MFRQFTFPQIRGIGSGTLRVIGFGSLAGATAPTVYLGVLSAAALVNVRKPRGAAVADPKQSDALTKFAVLIPAHDEAAVIEATVRALVRQRYPHDFFSVNVVADNCTDETADVARAAGADVYERHDPDDPGKGSALNWLSVAVGIEDYDAVAIVDADTIADVDFLFELHRVFEAGADVVQGDYGVSEPETSAAVGLRYAALACRHRLRPLGRMQLGCSCGLYGNGMAFRSSVLAQRRWSGHLVEDAEFQLDLLLDGVIVVYAPAARVEAEMPASLEASLTQNQRWELGRGQLIRRFLPALGRRSLDPPTGVRRRVYVDAMADQLVPPLSIVVALHMVALAGNVGSFALVRRRSTATGMLLSTLSAAVVVAHVIAGLRVANAPRAVWASLASAPRLVIWKIGLLAGVARRPGDVTWTRTARNATDTPPADTESSAVR